MNRLVAAACGVMLAGLAPAAPSIEPRAPADAVVASTVAEVLRTGRHPWLRWPSLADVAPAVRDLYGAEADGLVWFAGDRPEPALAGAVSALAAAAERGLDPADYDAPRIEAVWKRLQTAETAEGAERALFDLAVSAGVLREIEAVHRGRVDPRTLGWGYSVTAKTLDRPALLRTARAGGGVPALLNGLEPSYPHYVRNRRELAH